MLKIMIFLQKCSDNNILTQTFASPQLSLPLHLPIVCQSQIFLSEVPRGKKAAFLAQMLRTVSKIRTAYNSEKSARRFLRRRADRFESA